MTKNNIVLSLDDAGEDRYICGGKFVGLYDLKYLLNQYNIRYKTNFVIPGTYAIPTPYFDDYKINGGVPDHIVKAAMDCAKKLGGNVAVRSSADVEDQPGKTYSGQFESVLNVKTRAQMRNALNTVYASAANVPGAQMGVILQSMVPNPKMAGVAYSETWYCAPFVVLNYTEHDYADKILSDDDEPRQRFAASKLIEKPENSLVRLDLSNVNNSEYNIMLYKHIAKSVRDPERVVVATPDERKQYKNHFLISALCSQLEQDLGHPIDMEYVVDGNDTINIVQQRPYVLPKFYSREIDEHTTSIFSDETMVLAGTVGFVKRLIPDQADVVNGKYDLYIWKSNESVHVFTKNSVGVHKTFMFEWGESPFATHNGHLGNMKRENLDFTALETWGRRADFDGIHEGDTIMVDMWNGRVMKIQNSKQR